MLKMVSVFMHGHAPLKVVLRVFVKNEYNILINLYIYCGYKLKDFLDYLAVLTTKIP